MKKHIDTYGKNSRNSSEAIHNQNYSALFRRFIFLFILCSTIPLILAGFGIHTYYSKFATSTIHDFIYTKTDYHRKTIELFFKKQIDELQLTAYSHPNKYFLEKANLSEIFEMINQRNRSIIDLGIIDAQGNHMAYYGMYDLISKNYSHTLWFKKVMENDIYISDMFLGFRNEPHFIMAVTKLEKGGKWILRATINSETFRSLVENIKIGKTGEVYLVNRKGVFQTEPQFSGKILKKAPLSIDSVHDGIKIRNVKHLAGNSENKIVGKIISQTWLDNPNWMLVVSQDRKEAYNAFDQIDRYMLIFLFFTVVIMMVVSFYITKYILAFIEKRDLKAATLDHHPMQFVG